MRRRGFLLAAGTASFGGAAWHSSRGPRETLEVRAWFTEGAAAHERLGERVSGYLREALAPACESVEFSLGGVLDVGAEHGRTLLARRWPRLVVEGALGVGPVEPATDVNLLVTDGDPRVRPAGYGLSNVAAITGARHLAGAPRREAVDGPVPYSTGGVVAQLLLHETGHALGLSHDHGTVTVDGDVAVASPMVGGYAWSDGREAGSAANACGRSLAGDAADRRLGLTYGACARDALRSYRGGVLP